MRRWKEEIGSRSRRAPAFTVAAGSFLIGEYSHASGGQRFKRGPAVLVKPILLGGEKEFLTAPDRRRIELKNTIDESVGLTCQKVDGANVRDETDLQSSFAIYGIAKEDKRKSKSRQSVLSEVSHDGCRRKAVAHLGKSQAGMLRDQSEVTQDRESEAEAESVTLNFCHADQGRRSEKTLDFDDASRFGTDSLDVTARALAPGAEDFAAGANP